MKEATWNDSYHRTRGIRKTIHNVCISTEIHSSLKEFYRSTNDGSSDPIDKHFTAR